MYQHTGIYRIATVVAVSLALVLIGCGSDDTSTVAPDTDSSVDPTGPATSIDVYCEVQKEIYGKDLGSPDFDAPFEETKSVMIDLLGTMSSNYERLSDLAPTPEVVDDAMLLTKFFMELADAVENTLTYAELDALLPEGRPGTVDAAEQRIEEFTDDNCEFVISVYCRVLDKIRLAASDLEMSLEEMRPFNEARTLLADEVMALSELYLDAYVVGPDGLIDHVTEMQNSLFEMSEGISNAANSDEVDELFRSPTREAVAAERAVNEYTNDKCGFELMFFDE